MLIRKWSHGHSLFTGAFIGLFLASYKVWLLMAFVFLAGCGLTLFVVNTRKVIRWIGGGHTPLSMRQWRKLHRRVNVLRPDDDIPY